MTVEEVYVVDFHTPEALVERCHEVFPASPVAIRPRPHVVACLRRDKEFVAIGPEVLVHQSAHGLLGRTVDRAVVVGQVEMGDAVVKGIVGNLTTPFVGVYTAEVVPKTEAHLGQQDTGVSATLKCHAVVVTVLGCKIHFFHINL